ncbi:MAG: HAMP domain-containing histidine kinase [Prevotella sp.]|nr:HAMP domain-containing histidine kinase [Prevotella sp.]
MQRILHKISKKVLVVLIGLAVCSLSVIAQEAKQSELHQQAESEDGNGNIPKARYLYIRAYEDYANKGNMQQAVECGVKATHLYYSKDSYYQEAFDLLRRIDQNITAASKDDKNEAALHYQVTKERMQMYMKMHRSANVLEQLNIMEAQAKTAADENLSNDLLYNKAIYYYSFGQNSHGNAVFKEMATKLTAQKEYGKVDEVYQTLIANGRRSNNAALVAQSYKSYIEWKDSVSELKHADETSSLKKQIADNEATIADKDSSLTSRMATIIALAILAAALAAVLAVGAVVLMRYILLNRSLKTNIKLANDNLALKAKFIGNISEQLAPALQNLDQNQPEVKALKTFTNDIQTLSALESLAGQDVELEETQIPQFCESIVSQIRDKVRQDVTIHVNAPRMSANINQQYVGHILLHLLNNAAEYTPAGGTITLDYKKRGAHTHQFLVSDTGAGIAEEMRDNVFEPFLEVKDLTKGDGMGLPICRQMALNMNGNLDIDPNFTKGTRFVLDLHS